MKDSLSVEEPEPVEIGAGAFSDSRLRRPKHPLTAVMTDCNRFLTE